VDIADVHRLLIDIKDVFASILNELKGLKEREPSTEQVTQPSKGKYRETLSSINSYGDSKRANDNAGEPSVEVSSTDLEPSPVHSVSEDDMVALRTIFLTGEHEAGANSSLALTRKSIRLKGSNHILVETQWNGMAVKFLHESDEVRSRGPFNFLSRKSGINFNIDLSNVVSKEWHSRCPANLEGDRIV